MTEHGYFGKIVYEDIFGFFAEYRFLIPYFDEEVLVYLGEQYDDDGNCIDIPPTQEKLDEFATTLENFLWEIGTGELINDIQKCAFERYLEYQDEIMNSPITVSDTIHSQLKIGKKEHHFEYMKEIEDIRILDNNKVEIYCRYYGLDKWNGLGIEITDNKVTGVGDWWTLHNWFNN